MSGGSVSESTVEAVAVDWLASLGWTVLHGPDIAPDTRAAQRADYGEVVLTNRLRSALVRLKRGCTSQNPEISVLARLVDDHRESRRWCALLQDYRHF